MEINIGLGYYIEVTKRNYILKQRYFGKAKDGSRVERNKTHGHYDTQEKALRSFLEINQIPPEAKMSVDLMGYVKWVEESNERAVQALNEAIEGDKTENEY